MFFVSFLERVVTGNVIVFCTIHQQFFFFQNNLPIKPFTVDKSNKTISRTAALIRHFDLRLLTLPLITIGRRVANVEMVQSGLGLGLVFTVHYS